MRTDLESLIDDAFRRRAPLVGSRVTNAWRVLNGRADEVEGLVVEKLGDVLVAQLHEGRLQISERDVRRLVGQIHERLHTRAVYRKTFVRERAHLPAELAQAHADPKPWIGWPVEPEIPVEEHGLRFLIRPYDGFSVGLFLDQRDNRRRIRELAAGRRVLNTFAYTCAFSVAAAAGQAADTASVDLHKRYLEWGKRNLAANAVDLAVQRFFLSDTLEFYQRARRQNRCYDLIILDPPTFSRTRRPARTFVLQEQLDALLAGAVQLLDPGGLLFLSTNDRGISRSRLEQAVQQAAGRRTCTILERPALPLDFAGDPDYAKAVLVKYG